MEKSTVLITGIAGFIGFHLAKRLERESEIEIIGIDNLNDYYTPQLKYDRLRELGLDLPTGEDKTCQNKQVQFYHGGIEDRQLVSSIFQEHRPQIVINLAAQAGVRYSLENPFAYAQSNLLGYLSILEACRSFPVKHLIYASSSSVYGKNKKVPYAETDPVENPISLYAATKRSNELMGSTYSHLYGIPSTGLRFFTVYGPWGRPDMAYFSFTEKILNDEEIVIFGQGLPQRDFTYIDDIVTGIYRLMDKAPTELETPHRILNIGNHTPVAVLDFVKTLESVIGIESKKKLVDMQPGDVMTTFADVNQIQELAGFTPSTSLKDGLRRFFEWYQPYSSR